ncbi:MAG: DNA replication complex GINS family protein [Candidatus Thermoplasmatota archaeon]|jgi:DNA replication initiation complex subunit (GINS family)|nr:DNA replication complex GINS family protein [Candidatus Thermoplasmatota archaeon]MDP7264715.1 DNA replication complex GINS family protein [Candidatus Thermoplasmatota archaeon]
MTKVEIDIRDTLSKEKSDRTLAKLEDNFYTSAKRHLDMLEGLWQGKERGELAVERSYRKWKTAKASMSDIFISRLRKILTLVNHKIDGREPNLSRLVPEERELYSAMVFLVVKSKRSIMSQSEKDAGIMKDIIDLMEADPEGKGLLTFEESVRGAAYLPESSTAMDEIQTTSEMEDELPTNFFTSDRKKENVGNPEEIDEEEDDSFIEPYEDYAEKEQLGEGDIEVGPDPVVPEEMPSAPDIDMDDKIDTGENNDPVVPENPESQIQDNPEEGVEINGTDNESASILLRIIEDTGDFMSDDGNTYNLKKNEIAVFPVTVGTVLIAASKAEAIE